MTQISLFLNSVKIKHLKNFQKQRKEMLISLWGIVYLQVLLLLKVFPHLN